MAIVSTDIIEAATRTLGHPIDQMSFHAYDDNHVPIGSPLSALQYIDWLNATYSKAPIETLRQMAVQYATAIQSAKRSPGILPEALGMLILTGAVLNALATSRTPAPTVDTAPQPHAPLPVSQPTLQTSIPAPVLEQPTAAATSSVSTRPAMQTSIQPHSIVLTHEETETLLQLRAKVLTALNLNTTPLSPAELNAHVASLIRAAEEKYSTDNSRTPAQIRQEVEKYKRTVIQKSIELQSINARLRAAGAGSVNEIQAPVASMSAQGPALPSKEQLQQLRDEEQRLLEEVRTLEHSLDQSTLAQEQLHRIRTHIHIVEQLLALAADELKDQ